jgi:hypothetical protein
MRGLCEHGENDRLLNVFGDVATATIRGALVERRIHIPHNYIYKYMILLN